MFLLFAACVLIYLLHFSHELAYFLCSSFSLSTFHPQAFLADCTGLSMGRIT